MEKRIFRAALISFVLFTVMMLAGSGPALAGQDEAAVDKVRLDFNAAFSAGDTEGIARLIDSDGVWMPPGEPVVRGRDAIVARYARNFAGMHSEIELKPGDIQVCGDWAFISGAASRTDTPRAGGPVRLVS
ncbi:MAG: nuclear transport factor 2 family protein, partial [Nitrospirales bacterium]|nr:nuclear transport factor 2 family protein [Nitrospirales bacterium]